MRTNYLYYICVTMIICLYFTACTAPYRERIKDGKVYCTTKGLFKGRWFNYYERALSCMEGEFYNDALIDLSEAMKVREQDKRMSRTYGMRFIDYFPHREKGLIYYLLEKYEMAKEELNLSLEQEPSAKAYYYKDQILKHLMKNEKVSIPIIELSSLRHETWTKDDPIIISGSVKDRQYVSKLMIAGQNYLLTSSKQHVSFNKKLYLNQGTNELEIIAKNLLGGKSSKTITIHVDRSGPIMAIKKFDSNTGLQGSIYDNSKTVSLFLNTFQIPIKPDTKLDFIIPPHTVEQKALSNTITLIAKDSLGNETTLKILKSSNHPLYACSRFKDYYTDITATFPQNKKQPFSIQIKGIKDNDIAYVDILPLHVRIQNSHRIENVQINDRPFEIPPGKQISMNTSVRLFKEVNNIKVFAKDEKGNTRTEQLFIIKKKPSVFKMSNRYSIVIQSFSGLYHQNQGNFFSKLFKPRYKLPEITQTFQDLLVKSIQEKKRFQIFLREKNPKIANASLFGSIRNTKEGIEISSRLIDIATTKLMTVQDVKGIIKDAYRPDKDRAAWKSIADELSEKYFREFPMFDGRIVNRLENGLIVESSQDNIKMKWPVMVYAYNNDNKLLGSDTTIFGDGYIDELRSNSYKIKTQSIHLNMDGLRSVMR